MIKPKTNQRYYIETKIKEGATLRRNDCLKLGITRLAAFICYLRKHKGYDIVGEAIANDYIYYLRKDDTSSNNSK